MDKELDQEQTLRVIMHEKRLSPKEARVKGKLLSVARSTSPRLRSLLIKSLLVVVGVILGLVLAELLLRLTIPGSRGSLFAYTAKSERYKVMKANNETIVYGVPLLTNELGFRDAQTGPIAPKQPGEYRIIVLGDSFTVCAGVPYGSLATTQLERLVRTRAGSNSVRVINLATAGYSLIEYAFVLEEVGLSLQPDLVLVNNYVPNDYELSTWVKNREIAFGRDTPARATVLDSLYLKHAAGPTVGALWRRLTARFTPIPADSGRPVKPSFGEESEGWAENTAALLRIARRAKEHKIPLRVCLLPHPSNFAKQQAHHALVTTFCRQHDLNVTDTLPFFISSGRSRLSLRVNLIDSHPSAAYNSIAARAMFDAVSAAGFPPTE